MKEQSILHSVAETEVIRPDERLAILFDRHYPRLYRLARRLVPTIDDALDLVQETFVRAARANNPLPSGTAVEEAWLVRTLINIRRDDWRKASVRRRTPLETDARPRSPEAAWVARTTVWQALDRLPPRRRAIVVMHALEDMYVREIASLIGINSVKVRWQLSVGRRELSRVLKPHPGGDQ